MFFAALSKFLQLLIDAVGALLSLLVGLLPSSPFEFIADSRFGELIADINYFIPVYEFVTIIQAWLVAVGLYYLYSIWARWVKAID